MRDPAFEIINVDVTTGKTTVVLQKGILGSLSNLLKETDRNRKAYSILRRLGYELAKCGDVQYGKEDVDLDPSIIVR